MVSFLTVKPVLKAYSFELAVRSAIVVYGHRTLKSEKQVKSQRRESAVAMLIQSCVGNPSAASRATEIMEGKRIPSSRVEARVVSRLIDNGRAVGWPRRYDFGRALDLAARLALEQSPQHPCP